MQFGKKNEKSTCIFNGSPLYYASTVFLADWSSG